MKIKIICVGKLKEKYWAGAADEYLKRLSRYCKADLIEIKDEPVPEKLSPAQKEQVLFTEGEKIIKQIPKGSVVCTLEIGGKALSSENFARRIDQYGMTGKGQLTFIIGGSLGLAESVRKQSDWALSFSPMTFPHQLFRIMLLEQIYRAFKINNGETYHK